MFVSAEWRAEVFITHCFHAASLSTWNRPEFWWETNFPWWKHLNGWRHFYYFNNLRLPPIMLQVSRWQVTWTESVRVTSSSARWTRLDRLPEKVKHLEQLQFVCSSSRRRSVIKWSRKINQTLFITAGGSLNWFMIVLRVSSGLRAGDQVLEVNGSPVSGLDLDLLETLFTHQNLQLLLRRDQSPDPEEPTIVWPNLADPGDPAHLLTWSTGSRQRLRVFSSS